MTAALGGGDDWYPAIEGALTEASAAILLISDDFLTSCFIRGEEVPRLLKRRKEEGLRVIPLIVWLCAWQRVGWLKGIQSRPLDGRPLAKGNDYQIRQDLADLVAKVDDLFKASAPDHQDSPRPIQDEQMRKLSEALETAYQRKNECLIAGQDTTAIQNEIVILKGKIREDGQLRSGGFLLDGRFKLLESLGRGGFDTIWKSLDRERHALVAIKVLHSQYADDRTRRERFFRGARYMAALHHQGIVQVFEKQLEDEIYYFFVMEYLERGDFRQAVLCNNISLRERLDILLAVGEALQFAHERGIIHRDIKPHNIVLDRQGSPKLTDFDLVRALDTTGGTRTGTLGTWVYAAPEMMTEPQEAGVLADVYGLGMTVVFALYGRDLPFEVVRDTPGFIEKLDIPQTSKKVLQKATAWQ